MAEGQDVELIDVTVCKAAHLEQYDAVGLASGIYHGKFQDTVMEFARQNLPEGKDVFFVYTCGSPQGGYTEAIASAVCEKNARVLGEYGCRGFDTFGPFKLIGGVSKGHPDANELQKAKEFLKGLEK